MQVPAEPITSLKTSAAPKQWSRLALVILLLAFSVIAISAESFWIDELSTAYFAGQPSFKAMWQELIRCRYSELQAPLYFAYIWVWEHLVGSREWVLRAAGAPWCLLGAAVFAGSFRTAKQQVVAALLVSLHSFVWFYLNEARLYSIELGFAFLLFGALVHLHRIPDEPGSDQQLGWLVVACLSALALSLISALGMIWTLGAVLTVPAIFSTKKLLRWARAHWFLLGAMTLAFVPCGIYYLWTRWLGAEPSRVVARTDWRTLLFVVYELLGFNGLGPGRLALRESGVAALKPWAGFFIAYGVTITAIGFAGFKALRDQKQLKTVLSVTLALSVPLAILIGLGFFTRFRLLGRHCTPMLVVLLYVLVLGVWRLWESRRWPQRTLVVGFLALCLFSCLSQRFAPRHAKDDYRAAAEFAKTRLGLGESVWWNADTAVCPYYGLPGTEKAPVSGKAWLLLAPLPGFDQGFSPPDWVISSKPDSYDWRGGLRAFLADLNYMPVHEFTAFRVFRRVNSSQNNNSGRGN